MHQPSSYALCRQGLPGEQSRPSTDCPGLAQRGVAARCMWLIYSLVVILVVVFHVALIWVVKAGLQQDPVAPESPAAKNRAARHFPLGFHRCRRCPAGKGPAACRPSRQAQCRPLQSPLR